MAEYDELLFSEELREHKGEALADPFWDQLIAYKRHTKDFDFFTHLHVLVNQSPYMFNQAQRLFCVFWDRLWPPYEFWSYNAMERHLAESLARHDRHALAPGADTLRQWVHRLGLTAFRPAVITKYDGGGRIPPDGYCAEALVLAEIPVPLNLTKIM